MTPVYTVRACRWGDTETHSYIVGVYSTEELALKAADEEENWRGGKYQCEVLKWALNDGSEGQLNFRPQVIKPLPDFDKIKIKKLVKNESNAP